MSKQRTKWAVKFANLDHGGDATIEGEFWAPGDPGQRIPGRLVYRARKICKLILMGAFGEEKGRYLEHSEAATFGILLGVTIANEPLTLIGCVRSSIFQGLAATSSEVLVDTVVVGVHLPQERSATFMHAESTWRLINDWFEHSQFKLTPIGHAQAIVRDQREEDVLFSNRVEVIGATIKSRIRIRGGGKGRFGRVSLAHTMTLRIEPDGVASLQWYERQMRRLGNLLTLFVGIPVENLWLDLRDAGEEGHFESYRVLKPRWASRKRRSLVLNAPFAFPIVKERLCAAFEAWFKLCQDCEDVLDVFFYVAEDERFASHLQFLSMIQAIEGLLRAVDHRTLMDPDAFQRVREALTKSIPENTPARMRDALKARLKFANEPSLRRRLLDAVNAMEPVSREYALGGASNEDFVAAVVDGRNYLTHYDPQARELRLDNPSLAVWTSRMKTLLAIMLLRHLGFDEPFIVRQLKDSMSWAPIRSARLFREIEPEGEEEPGGEIAGS
jgi:hypothetical protein